MTKTWLDKLDFQFKFNRATPECKQDPKFRSWMEQLNQAILRNPRPNTGQAASAGNAGGNNDNSETDSHN